MAFDHVSENQPGFVPRLDRNIRALALRFALSF